MEVTAPANKSCGYVLTAAAALAASGKSGARCGSTSLRCSAAFATAGLVKPSLFQALTATCSCWGVKAAMLAGMYWSATAARAQRHKNSQEEGQQGNVDERQEQRGCLQHVLHIPNSRQQVVAGIAAPGGVAGKLP